MGSALSGFFIDTEDLPGCIHRHTRNHHTGKFISELDCSFGNEGWSQGLIQTLSIMCAYGLILYNASNMLSNGSELLLLVPSISGIVGSVVLPVLGAVPDGAIMLFSGLGDAAQENITVGVGTLAGSTIMLLTIPWSLSILLGAVPVDGGVAVYSRRQEKVNPCALSSFGVSPDATIRSNAYVMVATALLYLVIQGPAFQYATKPEYLEPPKSAVASHTEHGFALAGLMLTTAAFVGYLVLMVRQSQQSSPVREYRVTAVALKALDDNPHISLSGIIAPIIADAAQFQANVPAGQYVSASVMTIESVAKKKLAALLKPQFHKYDVDHDGKISVVELHMLLSDVGERLTINETRQWMERLDPDRSGEIEQVITS